MARSVLTGAGQCLCPMEQHPKGSCVAGKELCSGSSVSPGTFRVTPAPHLGGVPPRNAFQSSSLSSVLVMIIPSLCHFYFLFKLTGKYMLGELEFCLVDFALVVFLVVVWGEEMFTRLFRLEKWCPSGLNHHVIFSLIFS